MRAAVRACLLAAAVAVLMLVCASAQDVMCVVDGCQICSAADMSKCETCMPGYTADGYGGCSRVCMVANCASCVDGMSDACGMCNAGYVLNTQSLCVKKSNGAGAVSSAVAAVVSAVAVGAVLA